MLSCHFPLHPRCLDLKPASQQAPPTFPTASCCHQEGKCRGFGAGLADWRTDLSTTVLGYWPHPPPLPTPCTLPLHVVRQQTEVGKYLCLCFVCCNGVAWWWWCHWPCHHQGQSVCACLGWGERTDASCLFPVGIIPATWGQNRDIHHKTSCKIFLPLLWSFNTDEAMWLRRTCCSSTATSHTDSVSSSPVIPESSAAAEEKLDHKPAIVLETFRSSCAVPPLPSKHTNTTATQTASENRDESDTQVETYIFLCKEVLHLLLACFTEGVRL